jgi:hypothetical protein
VLTCNERSADGDPFAERPCAAGSARISLSAVFSKEYDESCRHQRALECGTQPGPSTGCAAAGHPSRDAHASQVPWNTPEASVSWRGSTVTRLSGEFADHHVRTYTGDPGETSFFALLKKSEILELAANQQLRPG